ncbi:hypothetical protein EPO33_03775 [Patescibacteria group bacterium]|nr:MAG: hypothetical protein EPO33_03775 [Patescibacteria group bacterium]
MNIENWKPKTALVSVSDKTGIVPFCRELVEQGITIYSTGGTAKELRVGGVAVTDVTELLRCSLRTVLERHKVPADTIAAILEETGQPFLRDRVKTLSREISAGLLARYVEEDRDELARMGIPSIDIVVVNFYPLERTIAKPGVTVEEVIEGTDIGGPTMVRSGAKGRRILVLNPACYEETLAALRDGRAASDEFITEGVAYGEYLVARYCGASAAYHGKGKYYFLAGERVDEWPVKYGENPQQAEATLYRTTDEDPLAVHRFEILEGSQPPSLVNITDLDRLLQTVTHVQAGFAVNQLGSPMIAVGVKHGNACGAAIAPDAAGALRGMLAGDLTAVHGGFVMTNFPIGLPEAELLRQHLHFADTGLKKRLLDGVIAPEITPEAFKELDRVDHGKCRGIVNSELGRLTPASLDGTPLLKRVRGGFTLQPNYTFVMDLRHARVEIFGELIEADKANVILAWAVGCTSNSNTISLVRMGALIGNGVGQQDRVFAAQTAIARATRQHHKDVPPHDVRGAVAYSDSFFPFIDGPEKLIAAGVRTIFATSGARKDTDVQATCKAAGVTLVMIPDKDGRGFFGHGV